MKRKEYPEEGEFIVGTVTKVQNYGAFVTLDEYQDREGFVHIAEIASGWVKRIRNHIKEKQKVVCKVMSVDEAKGHVDLSLKRVNEHQKREKIKEWKNNKKAARLFEMLADEINKTIDECWDEFGSALVQQYGSLYTAFEEAAYDSELLENDGFSGDWVSDLNQIAKDNIAIQFVDIKGYLEIKSFEPDGIEHIKNALNSGEETEYDDVNIEIHYIGAPHYSITVEAPDYKIAEEELKKAIDRVEQVITSHNGEMTFNRKLDE
ncbi:MAG TPA: translation initiation factor IF-2 subunit alpha [Candidatus Thermoplasmatota archaeon]|nr:translation initiation factor IF-2 subunit alpha [Candidatus Thermoplasmatota archaeon]